MTIHKRSCRYYTSVTGIIFSFLPAQIEYTIRNKEVSYERYLQLKYFTVWVLLLLSTGAYMSYTVVNIISL